MPHTSLSLFHFLLKLECLRLAAACMDQTHRHQEAETALNLPAAITHCLKHAGTSPLYALQSVFSTGIPSAAETLAAVSLIFWTLTLIVLVKYVGIIIRFDDNGEGEEHQQCFTVCAACSCQVQWTCCKSHCLSFKNVAVCAPCGISASFVFSFDACTRGSLYTVVYIWYGLCDCEHIPHINM